MDCGGGNCCEGVQWPLLFTRDLIKNTNIQLNSNSLSGERNKEVFPFSFHLFRRIVNATIEMMRKVLVCLHSFFGGRTTIMEMRVLELLGSVS